MAALSVDIIFEAAVRLFLEEEESVTVSFLPGEIRIRFPTTRRLAEFLEVPHYYVLPYFAMMEESNLVTRAERVGILTTTAGTKKLVRIMAAANYRDRAIRVLGEVVFRELETHL
jgi:Mn-dependent DtxR family transcriptional regulator